jgi:hypothetical protein
MKKVILHIGMHKTGSSAIQTYMQHNQRKLPADFLYADLGTSNHSGPFSFVFIKKPELDSEISSLGLDLQSIYEYKNLMSKAIDKAIRSEYKTILFSGEGIVKLNKNELNDLKNHLLQHVDIVEVYAYVRKPKGFMVSAFQQIIKTKLIELSSPEFHPNYQSRFEKFEDVFGSVNYRVFANNSLDNNDVVNDFCNWINIPYLGFERVNESLSNASVKLLYFIQKYRKKHQLSQENLELIEGALSIFDEAKFVLPHQVLDINMNLISDDILWMKSRVNLDFSADDKQDANSKVMDGFVISVIEAEMLMRLKDNNCFIKYIESECDLSLEEVLYLASFKDSCLDYTCHIRQIKNQIVGWAVNKSDTNKKIKLTVFLDGKLHDEFIASQYREDLKEANIYDACLGFNYQLNCHEKSRFKVFLNQELVLSN